MCEIFSTHRASERFSHEYRMSPHFYYCTKPEADDRVRTHGSGLKTCHLILFFFISPSEKLPSIKHFQCLIGVGTKRLLELPIGWQRRQRREMRCCCSGRQCCCCLSTCGKHTRQSQKRHTKNKIKVGKNKFPHSSISISPTFMLYKCCVYLSSHCLTFFLSFFAYSNH